jgi:purine-binding chemotaxis protein CheW
MSENMTKEINMDNIEINENVNGVEEEKQYIVVNIGDEYFGIDIMNIDNIVRMQRITRVPKAEAFFKGVINLRGEVLPVMSLRRKFGIDDDAITNASRIIIVKINGQYPVGILVDAVKEVISLSDSKIERAVQGVSSDKTMYLNGIGKYNNELISLLNIDSVIGVHDA